MKYLLIKHMSSSHTKYSLEKTHNLEICEMHICIRKVSYAWPKIPNTIWDYKSTVCSFKNFPL